MTRSDAAGHAPAAATANGGLSSDQARALIEEYGPNELPPPRRPSLAARTIRHLRDPMALLLIGAASVSGLALGEQADAIAILSVVVLNTVIGLIEEGRASRALDALREMEAPVARVTRDGRAVTIPSREVVPGDLVALAAGDRVPADVLLLSADAVEVDESMLTGESLPVGKQASGDEAFAGTLLTAGRATGSVTATGPRSKIGRIAARLGDERPPTPLQIQLARLAGRLGIAAVLIALGVFVLVLIRTGGTEGLERPFLVAVALAVAAVPQGLPTVVTVALALGVRRMATHGAIVRRLPALETLGSTTVIATDKTGTLTENRMRVEALALPGRGPAAWTELAEAERAEAAVILSLCNDATLEPPAGDPMEVAMLEAAGTALRERYPRLAELPFDAQRRRMATANMIGNRPVLLVKGAPEAVLDLCARTKGTLIDERARALELATAEEMARRGVRVLALARRLLPPAQEPLERHERDLEYIGMVGLRDPARPEAADAVRRAHGAGVEVLMVTGDHPGTASAIGFEVGIAASDGGAVSGDMMRAGGIPEDPKAAPVYARVDPEQKLALVGRLRERGEVVAVTGDGVNDAPALRHADIGVAMGRTGSDVAREAADMVITDDNLATIVTAIGEGRGIYDNIRKVVDYLVAGNLSEVLVVLTGLLLFSGLGTPLTPLQLLWINLLTDGPPALALGVDPIDPGLMRKRPRPRGTRMLDRARFALLLARGATIAVAVVTALAIARFGFGHTWERARTVAFTTLVVAHLVYALIARLPGDPRDPGERPQPWLLLSIFGGIGLQAIAIGWEPTRDLLALTGVDARDIGLIAGSGLAPIAAMWAWRRRGALATVR